MEEYNSSPSLINGVQFFSINQRLKPEAKVYKTKSDLAKLL
jgi:hypothetical protein